MSRAPVCLSAVVLALWAGLALGQGGASTDEPIDGAVGDPVGDPAGLGGVAARPPRSFGSLVLGYADDHPGHPPLDDLLGLSVSLTPTAEGFAGPAPGQPAERVTIRGLFEAAGDRPVVLFDSALQEIVRRITEELVARGLIGVFVREVEVPRELGAAEAGAPALGIQITTFRVTRVRSIASGDRVPTERRLDAEEHRRIRRLSPLRPYEALGGEGDEAGGTGTGAGGERRRDLLERPPLDDYARLMSRSPTRRVDVAIAAGDSFGEAEVQYLVREAKPWTVFFQLSNTGTEETDPFRQRFGLIHSQLTGNDDELRIDYITASFSASNAIFASYRAPVFGSPRLFYRVGGGYSDFEASDVGLFDESFSGESFFWNAELEANVLQSGDLFVDLFGGVRFQDIQISNEALADGDGRDAVFATRTGVRMERLTEATSLRGEAAFDITMNDIAGSNSDSLEELGRLDPDDDWLTFQWDLEASAFLEPLLNRSAYLDPSTPGSSTRAHEVALSFRGQYAFNNRLIPNDQRVVGGLFSVRGYEESVVAGDTVLIGSAEYRLHVPRLFGIDPDPPTLFGEPFRVAPQRVYGLPDWDFILRGFVDAARVNNSQNLAIEEDETLVSAGGGFEVQFRRNLTFRMDFGVVLDEVATGTEDEAEVGDFRAHLLLTVLF